MGGGGSKVGEVGRISMALVLEKSRGISEFRHGSTQSQKLLPGVFFGSPFFDPSMFSLTLSSFSGCDHFTHPRGKPWQLQSYNFSRRELSFLKTSSKRFEAYTLAGIRLLNQSLGLQVCFNFYWNRLNYKALQEPGGEAALLNGRDEDKELFPKGTLKPCCCC